MTTDTDAKLAALRSWAKSTGIGPKPLAIRAGLTGNALRGMFEPNWNPTAETLRKLDMLRDRMSREQQAA